MATIAVASCAPLLRAHRLDAAAAPPNAPKRMAMAMLSTRAVALHSQFLRRLRVPDLHLGRGCTQVRHSRVGAARAVWKQEVLWAEAPVADVGLECEEHYHFVLDISGNRELMEGHTKPGQFVQVNVGLVWIGCGSPLR